MNELELIASLASDLTLSVILLWLLVSERRRTDETVRRYESRHDRLVDWTLHNSQRREEPESHSTRPITRPDVD